MKPTVGIVLSGGGIRCAAHIGFLKALEQSNIQPTHLSGSGSGAIVAALYAAGYSPDDILAFFQKNRHIFQWSKMTIKKPALLDTEKYYNILFPYLGYITFEQLPKRLFVTATDVLEGKSHIFSTGEVIKTVLASSALPPVFSPIEIDNGMFIAGSVMNNFPIEPLLDTCEVTLGSFVSAVRPIEKSEISNAVSLLHRSNDLHRIAEAKKKFRLCDVVIEPKSLYKYGNFNADKIEEIYQIGYLSTMAQIENIATEVNINRPSRLLVASN